MVALLIKIANIYKKINNISFMPIVSISLNDDILAEMDTYQKMMRFSSRSEIVRAAIRAFMSDEKQKMDLNGTLNGILLVLHDDDFDNVASTISHNYEDIIITRTHSKIEGKICMELFLLKGPAEEIADMTRGYQTNKNMNIVKMIAF